MELKLNGDTILKGARTCFNRTLWNWNEEQNRNRNTHTCFNRTLWNWNASAQPQQPRPNYGFNRTLWNWNDIELVAIKKGLIVLIVPYGIEMNVQHASGPTLDDSFNRTLWNWNFEMWRLIRFTSGFNRTLWNWNVIILRPDCNPPPVLIVPYGIEMEECSR